MIHHELTFDNNTCKKYIELATIFKKTIERIVNNSWIKIIIRQDCKSLKKEKVKNINQHNKENNWN